MHQTTLNGDEAKMNQSCSCEMCLRDTTNAKACQNRHRDAMAERIMLTLLTTEHFAIQGGSGGGGLENQTAQIAFVAYTMADAMIEQSNGRGLQRCALEASK